MRTPPLYKSLQMPLKRAHFQALATTKQKSSSGNTGGAYKENTLVPPPPQHLRPLCAHI